MNRREILKLGIAGFSSAGVAFAMPAFAMPLPAPQQDAASAPVVFNAGVGGNNSTELLERLERDCLARKPDLTILMVGTNDMNSVKHVPLPQFEKNLSMLVARIQRSGSKLLMLSILPAYEPHLLTRHPAAFYLPEGVAGRRQAVNRSIEKCAKKHRAWHLDVCSRFEKIGRIGTEADSLLQNEKNSGKTDGIHPTNNGYRLIALSVYDFLTFHRIAASRIVCFGDSITKGDGSTDKNSYPAYLKQLLS
ncbi:esterase [Pedobacter yulinensis]|uniref:Esterase n=1 Tax=Pedobacter yulinensis TaxID=2126353 RepID=A0A2T3HJ85_9SPHI|nr:SGNH/GDSL hydrolase family protein [Pedobacter yulinensis]PST82515.1 esterase [Pedobacter yulinensis]